MKRQIPKFILDGDLGQVTTYQAGVMQAMVNRALQKRCDEVLKAFYLTKTQWLIIGTVLDAGSSGIKMSDLADCLDTNLPYITNTVNILESKDMLMRKKNNDDNRSKMICINPEFVDECQKIEHALRDALRHSIYADVSTEDFRTYLKVMYQLINVEPKDSNQTYA